MKILAITPYVKTDCLATGVIEGLQKLDDVELCCTDRGNGAANVLGYGKAIDCANEADYILAFFTKQETPPPKYRIIDIVNGWDKTAYLDGSEWNYTGYRGRTDEQLHPRFLDMAQWYFKRECTPEQVEQGVIPLPFAAVDADFGNYNPEKDIDVLCPFGHLDTGLRAEAAQAVRELGEEGYRALYIKNLPFPKYLETISRSWISVEAHGGGEINAGTLHIMANKSALFAQGYSIVIPNLEAGVHYVDWDDPERLKGYIRSWLEYKQDLQDMIDMAYDNLLQHHTSEARARYLLEHLQ